MFELLNGGKRPKQTNTPSEVIHLRFNETPFYEENDRLVETRSVSMITDGAFDKGLRPVASNGWVRTLLEPRDFTQAFTLEFFARRAPGVTLPPNQYCAIIFDPLSGTGIGIQYYNSQFYIYDSSGGSFKWRGGDNMLTSDNIYRHHALVFSAGTYRFFRAGQLLATFAGVSTVSKTAGLYLYMGGHPNLSISGTAIDFDEFLLVPGVAKYAAAFTPPAEPFYS